MQTGLRGSQVKDARVNTEYGIPPSQLGIMALDDSKATNRRPAEGYKRAYIWLIANDS